MRVLPQLSPENTAFWTGGEHGALMIGHCPDCDASIHPPELICPHCLSRNVAPRQAKGTGTVYSYTVNHQPWTPDMEVPFIIVVVDLDGESGVRLTARLRGLEPDAVAIGLRVRVAFEPVEDVWLPFFESEGDAQ